MKKTLRKYQIGTQGLSVSSNPTPYTGFSSGLQAQGVNRPAYNVPQTSLTSNLSIPVHQFTAGLYMVNVLANHQKYATIKLNVL